jgi:hypothetical protein
MLDPWVRVPLVLKDAKIGKYQADFYVTIILMIGPPKRRNLPVQDNL